MLIDRSGLARLIPHAGDMCLLDGVLHWDELAIECAAESHRSAHNPLRHNGRLGILCGVEYAAQAVALHAALVADDQQQVSARGGYLASLRAVSCHGDRLDLLTGTLIVEAARLHGEADRAIYRFTLRHEDCILLDGRAAVVLGDIPA